MLMETVKSERISSSSNSQRRAPLSPCHPPFHPPPSADVLSENGHSWVGLDVSPAMLDVALAREVEGDMLLNDIGQGFGFRAGIFDGAISVSALQWLCYNDKKDHKSAKRLNSFFASLYRCLRRGARAVLQIYPEGPEQLELMTTTALRCGFGGGLVVDYPNSTKAKKYFLCLFAGVDPGAVTLPQAKGQKVGAAAKGGAGGEDSEEEMEGSEEEDGSDEEEEEEGAGMEEEAGRKSFRSKKALSVAGSKAGKGVRGGELRAAASFATVGYTASTTAGGEGGADSATFVSKRVQDKWKNKGKDRRSLKTKSKAWVLAKKESQRRKGVETRPDSKYTGRKRSKFRV